MGGTGSPSPSARTSGATSRRRSRRPDRASLASRSVGEQPSRPSTSRFASMTVRAHLVVLAFLVPVLRLSAQGAPAYARLDSAVMEELRRTHTPGAAVALVSGDRVVYAHGFGTRSTSDSEPVTPETRFHI